jgi:hypothetical protein
MWISGQGVWITSWKWGKCLEQPSFLWGWLVHGGWGSHRVCVDWHSPGPAGMGTAGEMWARYPHSVRPYFRAVTRNFGVIPVLPTTTVKTGSLLIRKNETCGRRYSSGRG